jgi:hypothetical protein
VGREGAQEGHRIGLKDILGGFEQRFVYPRAEDVSFEACSTLAMSWLTESVDRTIEREGHSRRVKSRQKAAMSA